MGKTSKYSVFALILIFCGAAVPAWFANAEEEKPIESYSATISSTGGSVRGTTPVTIRIYSYTPDDDVVKLADLLQSKGQNSVAEAIWNVKRGYISPVGSLGTDINYVRVSQSGSKKIIRMVTARQMSFAELRNSRPSTNYPFGIVELTIGTDGKIQGTITGRAKITIDKNGVSVKSYGSQRFRLIAIRKDASS